MNTAVVNPGGMSMRTRSLGAKFFLIVLLALGMSLAGFLVEGLVEDRANNQGLLMAQSDGATVQPKTVLGLKLVDSYRSTRRSLHYITLFLGLVFLTYFLFEVMTGKSLHPAQYALVGVAQLIFYLLLLSLAEHLGFDWSFLIAGGATVGLFAANTEWMFAQRALAVRAQLIFSGLYAFIYVLLRVEAYALLIGALASFAAVAVAMYTTRKVDWYGGEGAGGAAPPPVPMGAGPMVRESWLR